MQSSDIPADRRAAIEKAQDALPPQAMPPAALREVWYVNYLAEQDALAKRDDETVEQAQANMAAVEAELAAR